MAHVFMEALWERLPSPIRESDDDGQLKAWLDGARSMMDDIYDLVESIDMDPESGDTTSTLVDPDTMEDAWIGWNEMIRGFRPSTSTNAERRAQLRGSPYRRGTRQSIAEIVQAYLTDGKSVIVAPFTDDTSALGAATEWDVCIIVLSTEHDGTTDLVQKVIDADCKPSGVHLHQRIVDSATWADIQSSAPTWGDWNNGSWHDLQFTNL